MGLHGPRRQKVNLAWMACTYSWYATVGSYVAVDIDHTIITVISSSWRSIGQALVVRSADTATYVKS